MAGVDSWLSIALPAMSCSRGNTDLDPVWRAPPAEYRSAFRAPRLVIACFPTAPKGDLSLPGLPRWGLVEKAEKI